jgi:hypothetical protein
MATDWCRAEVKADADAALLRTLVEQQALAYQSIWGWPSATADVVREDLSFRLHGQALRTANRELREALAFPGWNAEQSCPRDIPLLDNRRRTTAITHNPLFPPLWRCRAYTTFLPTALGSELSRWRTWAGQVADGEHTEYVRELHLHATCHLMKGHWSDLRHLAVASLPRTAAWATAPALREIRDAILRLPEPMIEAIRLDPSDAGIPGQEEIALRWETAREQLEAMVGLTRAWDAEVPGNKKLGFTERHYDTTIEQFRSRGRAAQLHDFLDWARQCHERGFALFLAKED